MTNLEVVIQLLEAMNFSYNKTEQNGQTGIFVTISDNGIGVKILIVPNEDIVRFMAYFPDNYPGIPEEKRNNVSLLFTYINYMLAVGSFQIDMSDGEVRYVYSCLTTKEEPISNRKLALLLSLIPRLIPQIYNPLLSVINGENPKQAFGSWVEGGK